MQQFGRLSLAGATVCAVLALSACTGTTYGVSPFPKPTPTAGTGAFLRLINASPDAGAVSVTVGGSPLSTNVPYVGTATNFGHGGTDGACGSGICAYHGVTTGPQNVVVSSAKGQLIANNGGVVVAAGQHVTIVLAGEVATGNLALLAFGETPFASSSGGASVSYHDASPASASGQPWTPGAFPVANPGNGVAFTPLLTYPPTGLTTVTNIAAPAPSQGIGFFIAPVGGGSGTIVFTPNLLDKSNVANVMPFRAASSQQNSEQNLSLYLVDGPGTGFAPIVVGIFDPNG